MAYPFTYPNYSAYNPYAQQQIQNQQQPTSPTPSIPQNNGIIWVQGEAGARAYMVAPNNTVQLWDSESQTIYLKSADSSGMPTIKILDYTIRNNEQKNVDISQKSPNTSDFATKEDILSLKDEINEIRTQIKPQKKTIKKGEKDDE